VSGRRKYACGKGGRRANIDNRGPLIHQADGILRTDCAAVVRALAQLIDQHRHCRSHNQRDVEGMVADEFGQMLHDGR